LLRNYVKSLLDLLSGLEPGTSWDDGEPGEQTAGEEQLWTAAERSSWGQQLGGTAVLEVRKVYLVDPTMAHPLFQGNKVGNKLN